MDEENDFALKYVNDVRHSLRTPLTSIKGYVQLLIKEKNINSENKNRSSMLWPVH